MRRTEFISHDEKEYQELTELVSEGHLGLVDKDGFPRIIPLNFAALNNSIYFHGARSGEKYDLILSRPKATFSISLPYSYIPSYFKSEKYACPASQFFKSIHIRGRAEMVEGEEAVDALNAMMRKYQPEGRYIPLTLDNPIYRNALREVAVFKVSRDSWSMKIKFGQNMSKTERESIRKILIERNRDMDRETLSMMEKYNPTDMNT